MPRWFCSFRALYLELDRRVLGIFRAGLGAVLLYDVLRRFPDAELLWSNAGVLGPAALHKVPQARPQISFLLELGDPSSIKLAFAGLVVIFALYALGLLTAVVKPLALLGYASLNAANLFFEDGGTSCVILLLGWTLFVPLGDRFSLDALLRDAAAPRLKERVAGRARAQLPIHTLAALAVVLQAAAIYWLNAAHKSGATWRSGEAVHLVLWQHRVNTPFATWFASWEPAWFSPAATWLTQRTEFVLPLLLLWPTRAPVTRTLAFVLAVLLHGGIALCLTLGPFSYAMICLVWLAVPGATLDAVARRFRPKALVRAWRWRAVAVRALRRRFYRSMSTARGAWAGNSRRWAALREAALALMLVVETANLLGSNRAVPQLLRVRARHWLSAYKPYLRGFQSWSMFAPDSPKADGTLVVDAVTAGGQHVDPFTGAAPSFEQIRLGLAPHSIALSDYFFALHLPPNARYRRPLNRYLRAYHVPETGEGLRSADVWWTSYTPPSRGSYLPGPITREKLWRIEFR